MTKFIIAVLVVGAIAYTAYKILPTDILICMGVSILLVSIWNIEFKLDKK